jgi:formate--tetrahydrofolate ligase
MPMEDINLHFTGDFHAITSANNLLAAMLDNHIYQGNSLGIDPKRITWKRAMDNERPSAPLHHRRTGGKDRRGTPDDGFEITAASEVMAILCLSEDLADLKRRLGNIIVGYTVDDKPVTASDLKAQGAMAALLRMPSNRIWCRRCASSGIGPWRTVRQHRPWVQQHHRHPYGAPVGTVHRHRGGIRRRPGAEKFLDIVCRQLDRFPDAVVIVATIRALKNAWRGGQGNVGPGGSGSAEGRTSQSGQAHREHHRGVPSARRGGHQPVPDGQRGGNGYGACLLPTYGCGGWLDNAWAKGGEGAVDLANEVVRLADHPRLPARPLYDLNLPLSEKIRMIVTQVYGGEDVCFSDQANEEMDRLERLGLDKVPVCVAKTQYSLSDNPKLLARPTGFTVKIHDVKLSAGAQFVVAYSGKIMTMPGLPKVPAAEGIDVADDGTLSGVS